MLEKPILDETGITACLLHDYQIRVEELCFLPLGSDRDTAVYRVLAADGERYFLKLRSGRFLTSSTAFPEYLKRQGISHIFSPMLTSSGDLQTNLNHFKVILYPFIEGQNAYQVKLTARQKIGLGRTLRDIHSSIPPQAVVKGVPRERFSNRYRVSVKNSLRQVENHIIPDELAEEFAEIIQSKREVIKELLRRATRYAGALRKQPLEFAYCHGDIHGWNLLIQDESHFYIVDWDTLIYAPKERDLMFFGGGLGGIGYSQAEEESLFYQGYGQVETNPAALAYYRCERILEDIAVFCEQGLQSTGKLEDRKQALMYLKSNFLPGGTIDIACRSDPVR